MVGVSVTGALIYELAVHSRCEAKESKWLQESVNCREKFLQIQQKRNYIRPGEERCRALVFVRAANPTFRAGANSCLPPNK